MLIYAGTKSDFMMDTENDCLETKLYENIKLKMNRTTGLSELNVWRNSLKAELLECFQWSDTEYDLQHIKEELADVLVYSQNLLDKLELDADEIVNMKMKQNEAKYPVDKAKGNATKYTELQLMRKMMCLSRCCYTKINKVMPENKKVQRFTKPEISRKTKKCEVMQQ